MLKIYLKLIITVLLLSGGNYAQVISEPMSNDIYNYLERLTLKNLIETDSHLKPYSRIDIASKLIEAEEEGSELSKLELSELEFYKHDYSTEIIKIKNSKSEKLRLLNYEYPYFDFFYYSDSNFQITAHPVLGYDFSLNNNAGLIRRRNGVNIYSYLPSNLSFFIRFRDNFETTDEKKDFTAQQGINKLKNIDDGYEYGIAEAGVSYAWDWGNISFSKEDIKWGSGRNGQIILSGKAPSFPFIKIDLQPAEWIRFIYIHGWLHSGLVDSSTIRNTSVSNRESYDQRAKYIAAHILSINPLENLNVSIGESIIYSDELEPVYLIPVMFFRLADHYLSKPESNSGDNAQLFADLSYKIAVIDSKVYATIYIDELSIRSLFEGGNLSALAYTAGFSSAGLFSNSMFTLEYTRANPFVYMNSNDAQPFTSHGYQLGHWIGSNADQFYSEYMQYVIRGLSIKAWYEFSRKGSKETPEQQYELPYPEFLFGEKSLLSRGGIDIAFEIIQRLKLSVSYSNIINSTGRFEDEYPLSKGLSFLAGISYGL